MTAYTTYSLNKAAGIRSSASHNTACRRTSANRHVQYDIRKVSIAVSVFFALIVLVIFMIDGISKAGSTGLSADPAASVSSSVKGPNASTVMASTTKEKYYTSIRIKSGDTLWGLAELYGQEYKDYSVFIDEVRTINRLSGDRITAGGCLLIPVYR